MAKRGSYCNYKIQHLYNKPFKARKLVQELIMLRDRSHYTWSKKQLKYGSYLFTLWDIKGKRRPVHRIKVTRKGYIVDHDFYSRSSHFSPCKNRPCSIIYSLSEHYFYAILKKKRVEEPGGTSWRVDEISRILLKISIISGQPYLLVKPLNQPHKQVTSVFMATGKHQENSIIYYNIIYKKIMSLPTVHKWRISREGNYWKK